MERVGKGGQPERRLKPFDQTQTGKQPEKSTSTEVAGSHKHDVGSTSDADEPTNEHAALMPSPSSGAADTVERERTQKSGKESPFLNALVGSLVFDAKSQILEREYGQLQQEYEELAEKDELRKQRSREAMARLRRKRMEEDLESYRAQEAARVRRQRTRKKQEAETQ